MRLLNISHYKCTAAVLSVIALCKVLKYAYSNQEFLNWLYNNTTPGIYYILLKVIYFSIK